ncbi:MAG: hypothetical protein JWP87_5176, partial [Labilithrix sp.]|nr:hypothetical protein [Labilithrix sp.]
KRTPVDPGDEFYDDDVPSQEDGLTPTSTLDSGAFSPASERPAPGPAKDDGGTVLVDAGTDSGTVQPKVFCAGALAAGDLAIGELLINSRAGSGDDGEWVEIRSTRTCWLKLQGLVIESPRGTAAPNTATITEDFELAPNGTFVVADSADPAKNHALPGKVFAWGATDVLKNDGDTVALKIGATVIDTITYPAFSNLVAGRTLAFPADCPANVRTDWTRWSLTFDVYSPALPGFKGTPNGANADVACY